VAKKGIVRSGFMTEIDQFLRNYDENRTQVPDSVQKEQAKHQKIALRRDKILEETINPIFKDF
jgi:hypothetical protein